MLTPRRGILHQIFCNQVQQVIKIWTQSDLRFSKNEGSKKSQTNEKGVNWIENHGNHSHKMIKNC